MNTKQNIRAKPSLALIRVYLLNNKRQKICVRPTPPGTVKGLFRVRDLREPLDPRRMSQPGSSLSSVCLSSSPSASHLKQPPCAEWFLSLTMERRGTKPCASHERGVSLQHHDFSLATTAPCSVAAAAHRSSWSRQRMPETAWTRTPQL